MAHWTAVAMSLGLDASAAKTSVRKVSAMNSCSTLLVHRLLLVVTIDLLRLRNPRLVDEL